MFDCVLELFAPRRTETNAMTLHQCSNIRLSWDCNIFDTIYIYIYENPSHRESLSTELGARVSITHPITLTHRTFLTFSGYHLLESLHQLTSTEFCSMKGQLVPPPLITHKEQKVLVGGEAFVIECHKTLQATSSHTRTSSFLRQRTEIRHRIYTQRPELAATVIHSDDNGWWKHVELKLHPPSDAVTRM